MQCVQGKKATKKSWQNKTLRSETSCWMIKNGRLLKIASYNDLKCVEIPVKSRSLTNSENLFVWNAVFCAQSRLVWIFYPFASAMKMKPNENSVSIAETWFIPIFSSHFDYLESMIRWQIEHTMQTSYSSENAESDQTLNNSLLIPHKIFIRSS